MKKRILKKCPSSIAELHKSVIDVWNNEIPKDLTENLIKSMPKRLKMVIENKGDWIKY